MKNEKLKSCPFCGLPDAEIVVNGYGNYYQAWCRRCGASAGKCYWGNKRKLDLGGIKYLSMEVARENAIKKWNMRPKTVELHFREQWEQDHPDFGDYPDEITNQFDNLTGSMNV